MKKDIGDVEVIRGAIETLLEFIRELYDADVVAIFLISEGMHDDEKLSLFKNRLQYIKKKYEEKTSNPPKVIKKYLEALSLGEDELRKHLDEIDILKFCLKEVQKEKPSLNIDTTREPKDRLWKYTYKERPNKWVIFNNYTNKKLERSIIGEGLTAYSVRVGLPRFVSGSHEMDNYPCLTHLNAKDHRITPECKMVAFFPMKSEVVGERVIGLLKIENYTDKPLQQEWFNQESSIGKCKKREVEEKYLPLVVKLVEKLKRYSEEYSYEHLYGVSPTLFLSKLREIRTISCHNDSCTDSEKRLLDKTEHLLWVLQRKEYVGHKDIMLRVTNYADDIAEDIGISTAGFFKILLDERKKHEDLMLYETERYRDHFMHSFLVFLMGYIIINRIGLKNIREILDGYLGSLPKPYRGLKFYNEDILRVWFLTAFLHDAAYVFEKFTEGMSNFTQNEWGHPFVNPLSSLPMLNVYDSGLPYSKIFGNMLNFLGCKEGINVYDMLSHYLKAISKNDHATLSALWLLSKEFNLLERTENGRVAKYIAALAISFHNPIIFEHIMENSQHRIFFESFPFAYLLAFCDTAQEWGRRTAKLENDSTVQLAGLDVKDEHIILSLAYSGSREPNIDIKGIDHFFKSLKYKFEINFYYGGMKEGMEKKLLDNRTFF